METSSAIIGVALIILFVGPILYVIYQQSNKDKKRLKNLKELSGQYQMNLDYFEVSNSLFLGLDTSIKRLIVVEPKNEMQYNVIDLHKINRSSIAKTSQPSTNGYTGKPNITHVSLELLNNTTKESEIVFYDEDDDASYDVETQLFLANKWDQLIKTNMSA